MHVTYDTDAATVIIEITDGGERWAWTRERTYAIAHDPIRGRVGAVMLFQEAGRPVYITHKGRTVDISVRRIPFSESLRLDTHVTLDLGEDGTVRAISVEE